MFTDFNQVKKDFSSGKAIVLADDSSMTHAYLACSINGNSDEMINFFTKEARSLICVAITDQKAKELELNDLNDTARDKVDMPFTISVDGGPEHGITTGISAWDRYKTIELIADSSTKVKDLKRPGHIFPLKAVEGGVLKRAGVTEAAVDLAKITQTTEVVILASILKEDGELCLGEDLQKFANKHQLSITNVAEVLGYRYARESIISREVKLALPNKYSEDFDVYAYIDQSNGKEHIALVKGDIDKAVAEDKSVLVRVHSECLTSDLFGSFRSDDGEQLRAALKQIVEEGVGVFVYLREEGRGLGLINHLKAFDLQDQGYDTIEANKILGFPSDLRNHGVGAQILCDIGVKKLRLLTNNPKKIFALEGYGLEVTGREPIKVQANVHSEKYLQTKESKMGHLA